jgi:hypothetical protein
MSTPSRQRPARRRSASIVAALGDLLADQSELTNLVDGYVFGSTPLAAFTPSEHTAIGEHGLETCRPSADRSAQMSAHFRQHSDRGRRQRSNDHRYVGHASIQIRFDPYGHLMPRSEREAATLVDEAW